MTTTCAIITAGGRGRRMGGAVPKQFLQLAGRPLLAHTLERFAAAPCIDSLVLVVPAAELARGHQLAAVCDSYGKPCRVVAGGASRQASVAAGLAVVGDAQVVAVHDGARPLVSQPCIQRVVTAAIQYGAAVAGLPARDTLKEADGEGRVLATVDRRRIWQAQTPQAARRQLLCRAFERAAADGFQGTDEASLLEHAGIEVRLVAGDPHNLKVTVPEDLVMANALLGGGPVRVGHGFDAHRLVEGRPLVLGGVTIPWPLGLLGHSDADVLTHALMDAMLGGAGLGDIGRHFPDTDPAYKGISSLDLLARVVRLLADEGLRLGNADVTIIAQAPKLAPHIPAMTTNLGRVTGCSAINLKATTTEQMGFAGRGEGIAAHAVVTLVAAVG